MSSKTGDKKLFVIGKENWGSYNAINMYIAHLVCIKLINSITYTIDHHGPPKTVWVMEGLSWVNFIYIFYELIQAWMTYILSVQI